MKALICLVVLIVACKPSNQSEKSQKNVYKSEKDTMQNLSAIEQYLHSGFGHKGHSKLFSSFEITDTLVLNSLGAVIYHFGTPYTSDDSEYDVIHDLKSGQFFNIVRPGWPSIGMYPSYEKTMMLLEDDCELETVNFDYLGMESYLNQCVARSGKIISKESLDTLFNLHELDMKRMKSQSDINTFFNNSKVEISPIKLNSLISALLRKMKNENVFIYQNYTRLICFEINPQNDYWTYMKLNSKDSSVLSDFENYVFNQHQQIHYNLKVFYISSF